MYIPYGKRAVCCPAGRTQQGLGERGDPSLIRRFSAVVIVPVTPARQGGKDTVIVRSDIKPESRLLTPAEVAALFRVDPKTVTRWAQQGKLHSIRTLGGHRRYSEAEIQEFLKRSHQVPHPRSTHD